MRERGGPRGRALRKASRTGRPEREQAAGQQDPAAEGEGEAKGESLPGQRKMGSQSEEEPQRREGEENKRVGGKQGAREERQIKEREANAGGRGFPPPQPVAAYKACDPVSFFPPGRAVTWPGS